MEESVLSLKKKHTKKHNIGFPTLKLPFILSESPPLIFVFTY